MKKKFRIWLNIVTICFCIAAIAVGVYAATNASVTASGKIGFTAHNSKITAGGYIYGHAAGNVHDGLPTDINSKDTFSTITVDGTATGVTGTLNIGDRYFSDMASTDGTPAPIVIVIEVTNESNYDITVSTNLNNVDMPANVSVELKDAATTTSQTISNKAKATFEFTLTLTPSATGTAGVSYKTFSLTDFSIPITSVKYTMSNVPDNIPEEYCDTEQGLIYMLNEDGKSWSVKGDWSAGISNSPKNPEVLSETLSNNDNVQIQFQKFYVNPTAPDPGLTGTSNVAPEISIAAEIMGLPVTHIAECAFGSTAASCHTLTKVTLPNSIATIGDYAFYNCLELLEISILPNALVTIGDYAFYNCRYLFETLIIPNSVTSIGEMAFFYCASLTSVSLGSGITSIGTEAFSGCSGLTSVTIPNSVTSIGDYAFWNCSKLTTVEFLGTTPPSFGTTIFDYCSALATIYVPGSTMGLYVNANNFTTYASKIVGRNHSGGADN